MKLLTILAVVSLLALQPQNAPVILRGELAANDAVTSIGKPFDAYEIPARIGQRVNFQLRTDDFDSYLIVVYPSGDMLVDVTGSRSLTLETWQDGKWLVVVTSSRKEEAGKYELAVEERAGPIGVTEAQITQTRDARAGMYASTRAFARIQATEESSKLTDDLAAAYQSSGEWPLAGQAYLFGGDFHRALKRPAKGLLQHRIALTIGEKHGYRLLQADAHDAIAADFVALEQVDSAIPAFQKALSIKTAINERSGAAWTLHEMGWAMWLAGDADSAVTFYQRSIAIRRDLGQRNLLLPTLGNLRHMYETAGWADSALHYERQAIEILRTGNDSTALQNALLRAARLEGTWHRDATNRFFREQQYDSAIARARLALASFEQARDTVGISVALNNLGAVHHIREERNSAIRYYRQAIELRAGKSATAEDAATFENLATLFKLDGPADSALMYYQRAIALRQQLNDRTRAAKLLLDAGNLYLAQSQPDSAIRLGRRAAALLTQTHDSAGVATANEEIAFSFGYLGQRDSAIAYYERAASLRRALGQHAAERALLQSIAHEHEMLNRLEPALQHRRRSLAIARQLPDSSALPDDLAEVARLHWRAEHLDSALIYFQQVAQVRNRQRDTARHAHALQSIGAIYRNTKPDSSLIYLRRNLALRLAANDSVWIQDAYTEIAKTFLKVGAQDSAIAYYALSHQYDDARTGSTSSAGANAIAKLHADLADARRGQSRKNEAYALYQLGREFSAVGQTDSAFVFLAQAAAIDAEIGDAASQSTSTMEIGTTHLAAGRPDSALAYYQKALALQSRVQDQESIGGIYHQVGSLHFSLGRPDSALHYMREAARAHASANKGESEALALANIGYLHANFDRADSAASYYRRAYLKTQETYDRATESTVRRMMGDLHAKQQRSDSALTQYRSALGLARAIKSLDGEYSAARSLAALFDELAVTDSALSYAQRSLEIARLKGDPMEAGGSTAALADTYYRLAKNTSRAIAYYDTAAALLSSVRAHAGRDADRISFAEQLSSLTRSRALALLNAGQPEAALAAAERGRAQSLLDIMRGASRAVRVGEDLTAEAKALLRTINVSGTATLSYTVTRDTVIAWLALPNGELHVERKQVADSVLARTIAEFRAALNVDSAAVRNVGDLEVKEGPRVRGSANSAGYAALARRIADYVFPASLQQRLTGVQELVIVADRALTLLPFAALPTVAGEPLVARWRLRYAPSLTALVEAQKRVAGKGNAMVVGNPAMPKIRTSDGQTRTLSNLPGAEREGRAVAALLGTPLLTGAAATENAVIERMTSARTIHMATHGYAYASEARARDSFVALAPTATRDGRLTVGEILDEVNGLSAELVVLSACQTGLGDMKDAEGTVGLQRAFLAKGARSVLVTLWSVDDAVTERLMLSFYRHWTAGASKTTALQSAQEEIRKTHPNPRYWAAFQLVGAN